MLSLGQLYKHDDTNDADDDNDDDDNDDTNDDDNDTWWTNHDCSLIGMYAKWAKNHTRGSKDII